VSPHWSWVRLLKRVLALDMARCPWYPQGALRILATLTQGEISGVVESNRAGIRKRCWQPALDSRSGTGATSARVVASLIIGIERNG